MNGGGAGVVWQIGPAHFVLLFLNFSNPFRVTEIPVFFREITPPVGTCKTIKTTIVIILDSYHHIFRAKKRFFENLINIETMDGGGAGVVWQIGQAHFVLLFVNFPKMLKSTKTDHFLKRYHVIIRHASNCEFALFETIFAKKSKINAAIN